MNLSQISLANNSLSNSNLDGNESRDGNSSWGQKPGQINNEISKSDENFPRVRSDGDDFRGLEGLGERMGSQGRQGGNMSFFGQ